MLFFVTITLTTNLVHLGVATEPCLGGRHTSLAIFFHVNHHFLSKIFKYMNYILKALFYVILYNEFSL